MTDLVDELANELRHYRHSDMASGALAEHILAIPRIHDVQTTIEALSERIAVQRTLLASAKALILVKYGNLYTDVNAFIEQIDASLTPDLSQ